MKLRAKSVLTITITVVVFIVILYFAIVTIIIGGFKSAQDDLSKGIASIEEDDTRRNVQRVTDALNLVIDNLAIKAADWAQWDDTYRYIVDKNSAYEESNLTDDALLALKINLLCMINSKGTIVFSKAFDIEEEKEVALPKAVAAYLTPESPLVHHDSTQSLVAGIIMTPQNPLMIVSRPILTSGGEGPIRGAFIFGRYLDSAERENLSAVTHLSLSLASVCDSAQSPDFRAGYAALQAGAKIYINAVDTNTIAGYTALADIHGKDVLVVRVDTPRQIHRQGLATRKQIDDRAQKTVLWMITSLLVFGLILTVVIGLTLEFSVLSRLGKLSSAAAKIGTKRDFTSRIRIEGNDEIAHLAVSINQMLEALASSHALVEARTAEMRLLMNTIPVGLIGLDEHFAIKPEYSLFAEKIFQKSGLSGFDYARLLFPDEFRCEKEIRKITDFLDVLRKELIPEKDCAGLNPFMEMRTEAPSEKWLRLRYFLIHRETGLVNHILAVIEDISQEKKLAEQVKRSQADNLQLKAIAEDPDLFREFLVEVKTILTTVRKIIDGMPLGADCRPQINELYRGVHTIKGITASFALTDTSEKAGLIEEILSPLQLQPVFSQQERTKIIEAVVRLETSFSAVVSSSSTILGENLEKEKDLCLRIPLSNLRHHMDTIRTMTIDTSVKEKIVDKIKEVMLQRLKELELVPSRRGLGRSIKIVPSLINRLGKKVTFNFQGQDVLIDFEKACELNTPLVHLIRNALDHGIETPDDRLSQGKAETGTVTLAVSREKNYYCLVLTDDGRGLDTDLLKKKAVENGFLSQQECVNLSRQQCLDLIYLPGLSTAEKVTDVSGRGVGMDAVKESIEHKLKGTIMVDSEYNHGTTFTIKIPV
ncbi:MAG: HAMP domain-containing protein [Chitinivibrionales bacterium]|nr:HAMP domain-containing protein [Chitinivibrionales bacterium]